MLVAFLGGIGVQLNGAPSDSVDFALENDLVVLVSCVTEEAGLDDVAHAVDELQVEDSDVSAGFSGEFSVGFVDDSHQQFPGMQALVQVRNLFEVSDFLFSQLLSFWLIDYPFHPLLLHCLALPTVDFLPMFLLDVGHFLRSRGEVLEFRLGHKDSGNFNFGNLVTGFRFSRVWAFQNLEIDDLNGYFTLIFIPHMHVRFVLNDTNDERPVFDLEILEQIPLVAAVVDEPLHAVLPIEYFEFDEAVSHLLDLPQLHDDVYIVAVLQGLHPVH